MSQPFISSLHVQKDSPKLLKLCCLPKAGDPEETRKIEYPVKQVLYETSLNFVKYKPN